MNLREKTLAGLTWSGLSQGVKQASQFVITAILARLLSPDDFGLLGMATVFTGFVSIFSELGVSGALVQKQDADERHYSSAFWLNVAAGITLMCLFALVSPFIADFYGKENLQPILMVLSLNFFLSAFTIIQQAILSKQMDFRSLAICEVSAVVGAGLVGIIFAFRGAGVWSLVYQSLTFSAINSTLLWYFSAWRPKFIFSFVAIKDIFAFSANMTAFQVVNYFARNVDYLLIGKFLGTHSLGLYTLAYKLMMVPLQNISWVLAKVMFPAFSRIQDDLPKVREVYLKMVQLISSVTFPLMLVLFIVAPQFIHVIYGPKWYPVIDVIRVFCFCGMIQSVATSVGTIYQSLGRADIQLRMGLLGAMVSTTAIIVGLQWDIYGVAVAYTICAVVWSQYTFYVAMNLLGMPRSRFYGVLGRGLLYCIPMVVVGFIVQSSILPDRMLRNLVITTFVAIVVYVITLLSFKQINFQWLKREGVL
jgi:O-antigen/teichoic acid export membrane protein